jgi:D-arabinose 1-dehydrogenase-like Zn-dependent alcohol dehydrogenase
LGGSGKWLIVGAGFDSLSFSPLQLIGGRKTIHGWALGTAKDSEVTLQVSSLSGVRPTTRPRGGEKDFPEANFDVMID